MVFVICVDEAGRLITRSIADGTSCFAVCSGKRRRVTAVGAEYKDRLRLMKVDEIDGRAKTEDDRRRKMMAREERISGRGMAADKARARQTAGNTTVGSRESPAAALVTLTPSLAPDPHMVAVNRATHLFFRGTRVHLLFILAGFCGFVFFYLFIIQAIIC